MVSYSYSQLLKMGPQLTVLYILKIVLSCKKKKEGKNCIFVGVRKDYFFRDGPFFSVRILNIRRMFGFGF